MSPKNASTPAAVPGDEGRGKVSFRQRGIPSTSSISPQDSALSRRCFDCGSWRHIYDALPKWIAARLEAVS